MNPIKHAFERTKKKKTKMNIKISFFSSFRQKLIFLYVRKIPPAHTQTKIETKMGRRKKSKKSDMWGKIITREDKENLYNECRRFFNHITGTSTSWKGACRQACWTDQREQYPCILYEFAPRKRCKDQFSFFRHQLNKKTCPGLFRNVSFEVWQTRQLQKGN